MEGRFVMGDEYQWLFSVVQPLRYLPGTILMKDHKSPFEGIPSWYEYLLSVFNHVLSFVPINVNPFAIAPMIKTEILQPTTCCPGPDSVPTRTKGEDFLDRCSCPLGIQIDSHSSCKRICIDF
jgi:hypothetical protein